MQGFGSSGATAESKRRANDEQKLKRMLVAKKEASDLSRRTEGANSGEEERMADIKTRQRP